MCCARSTKHMHHTDLSIMESMSDPRKACTVRYPKETSSITVRICLRMYHVSESMKCVEKLINRRNVHTPWPLDECMQHKLARCTFGRKLRVIQSFKGLGKYAYRSIFRSKLTSADVAAAALDVSRSAHDFGYLIHHNSSRCCLDIDRHMLINH